MHERYALICYSETKGYDSYYFDHEPSLKEVYFFLEMYSFVKVYECISYNLSLIFSATKH